MTISKMAVIVTGQETEHAQDEDKVLDNHGSGQTLKYELEVKNTWRTEIIISEQKLTEAQAKLGIPVESLKLQVNGKIEKSMGITQKETRESTRVETIWVDVPAGEKLHACIRWFNVWQLGNVAIETAGGGKMDIPFRVLEEKRFNVESGLCPNLSPR
jgi:hypothetical protein